MAILNIHWYGSSYMSPHAYGVMMRTNNFYLGIFKGTLTVDEMFTRNLPDWPGMASSRSKRIRSKV